MVDNWQRTNEGGLRDFPIDGAEDPGPVPATRSTRLRPGDIVRIISDGSTGEVLECNGDNIAVRVVQRSNGAETVAFYLDGALTRIRAKAERPRARLLSMSQILQLPPIEWLIDGVLPTQSLGEIFGEPKIGKTFVVLSMANAIATGEMWFGRRVKQGRVIYIAGEGCHGLRPRMRALSSARLVDPRDVIFTNFSAFNAAVQLLDADDLDAAVETIAAGGESPVLIIVDTLARCFVGHDENKSSEMGLLVARCDELRERFNAAVLLVHHSTKNNAAVDRGSSALRGAADVVIVLDQTENGLQIQCTKQKDAAEFAPISIELELVTFPASDLGPEESSLRVICAKGQEIKDVCHGDLAEVEWKIAKYLCHDAPTRGMTASALFSAVGIPKRTGYRYITGVRTKGYVDQRKESTRVYYLWSGKEIPA